MHSQIQHSSTGRTTYTSMYFIIVVRVLTGMFSNTKVISWKYGSFCFIRETAKKMIGEMTSPIRSGHSSTSSKNWFVFRDWNSKIKSIVYLYSHHLLSQRKKSCLNSRLPASILVLMDSREFNPEIAVFSLRTIYSKVLIPKTNSQSAKDTNWVPSIYFPDAAWKRKGSTNIGPIIAKTIFALDSITNKAYDFLKFFLHFSNLISWWLVVIVMGKGAR